MGFYCCGDGDALTKRGGQEGHACTTANPQL